MKSIEIEVVALVERNGRLILQSAGMEQEKGYIQHGAVSCYLHSFFVAYMSVWLAKRFRIRVHLRSLVRGALLHDYFLYDWHIKDPDRKAHGFSHAAAALQNAERDFALNAVERDIIARHMFPLNLTPHGIGKAFWFALPIKSVPFMKLFRFRFQNTSCWRNKNIET